MKDLDELRAEIDKINVEMFELYLKRDALTLEIAKIKKAYKTDIFVKSREEEIIKNLVDKFGVEKETEIRKLFGIIMEMSKKNQQKIF